MVNNVETSSENSALIKSATSKALSPFRTDKLVAMGEFREFLGISPAHMQVLMKKGELPPSFKIGRRRYYDPNDISTWLQARKNAA